MSDAPRVPIPATERVLAGFCHDVNGRLAAAEGFLHLLADGDAGADASARLRDLLMEVAEMTAALRSLVRDEACEPAPTSLGEVTQHAARLLAWHPRLGRRVPDVTAALEAPAVSTDHAAAVRTVLLALQHAAESVDEGEVRLAIEVEVDRVVVRLNAGPPSHGLADALAREAGPAGAAIDWEGGSVRVIFARLGRPRVV